MEGLWVLAVLWAVLSFLGRLGQRPRRGRDLPPEEREQPRRPKARRSTAEAQVDPAEEWRREIERLLGVEVESERGPLGRSSGRPLPEAEEVEELESLEVEPEVVSLEDVPVARSERAVRDQDEEVLPILRQRLAAAEARTRGRSLVDHRRFDERIRRPAPMPAPKRPRPALRQAVIWREVLGPPVALRRED